QLRVDYLKLQTIKSAAEMPETEAGVDEVLRSENQLHRQMLEDLTKQHSKVSDELIAIKRRYSEITRENVILAEEKHDLERKLDTTGEEKTKLASELTQLKSELETKMTESEKRLEKTVAEYRELLERKQSEMANQKSTCDLYQRQIETYRQRVGELERKLETSTACSSAAVKS